jgi:hypothetical protein
MHVHVVDACHICFASALEQYHHAATNALDHLQAEDEFSDLAQSLLEMLHEDGHEVNRGSSLAQANSQKACSCSCNNPA